MFRISELVDTIAKRRNNRTGLDYSIITNRYKTNDATIGSNVDTRLIDDLEQEFWHLEAMAKNAR